ncbi:MAG TPA: ribosomal protein S18-alanine N-acetyltransferase [Polyangiaceae bacterium]|jgi:ribosomal-protein-alanine N-acetyltransferase
MIRPFRVDPMAPADIPDVLAIEGASGMSEQSLGEELRRPWSRIWAARQPGSTVDAFLVSWHVADELHVLNVATRPDARRRGLGRALMDEVVGYARQHHLRHVLLEVRRSNAAAIALYRSTGFYAMSIRARYYADGEDAVEMVLPFDTETGAILTRADEVRLDE